jgi:uncharacterized SAM-binding protein YcdF (DUF218 family)
MPRDPGIAWSHCPSNPQAWIGLRELLLQVLYQPALLLPLAALLVLIVAWWLAWPPRWALISVVLVTLSLSVLYSPAATAALDWWLQAQLPPPMASLAATPPPMAVIPGRGPQIAAATTVRAAELIQQRRAAGVYVSGDSPSTAARLVSLGVAVDRIAGDSCARTTWENATRTAAWLRNHHPGAPVLLITDPWHLPRASRAFLHQGLKVMPIPAVPSLPAEEKNRLALREVAGTLLYALQGRM